MFPIFLSLLVKVKVGKFHPITGHEGPEVEYRYNSRLSLTSALDGGRSIPRLCYFAPGKDPVPILQEGGLAPGPVWTGAENLASTGIRSPDLPARSVVAIPTALSTSLCLSQ